MKWQMLFCLRVRWVFAICPNPIGWFLSSFANCRLMQTCRSSSLCQRETFRSQQFLPLSYSGRAVLILASEFFFFFFLEHLVSQYKFRTAKLEINLLFRASFLESCPPDMARGRQVSLHGSTPNGLPIFT